MLTWTLFPVGGGFLLLASPCFLFGALGLTGVLADVSVAENRDFGLQFPGIGLIPFAIGVVLLIIAYRMRPR